MHEVEQAVEWLHRAMIGGDRAMLAELTADELTYGHAAGHVEDKSQFIEKLASGKSGWSRIEHSDQTVRVVDNIAVVRHIFHGMSRNPPDGIVHKRIMVLGVWIRRAGRWRLLARQAVQPG